MKTDTLDAAWTPFVPSSPLRLPPHTLSLSGKRVLYLPREFLTNHHLGENRSAKLFWHPETQRFAFILVRQADHDTVKLSGDPDHGFQIALRRFSKHFKLDLARLAGRYRWQQI